MIFDQTQVRFLQIEPVIVSKHDREFLGGISHDKSMQSDMHRFPIFIFQMGFKHNFRLIQKWFDHSPLILPYAMMRFVIELDLNSLFNFKFSQNPDGSFFF
jgi:hypothetical protein